MKKTIGGYIKGRREYMIKKLNYEN